MTIKFACIACHELATPPRCPKIEERDAFAGHGVEGFQTHPECPSRIRACLAGISARGLWPLLQQVSPRLASDEELRVCHGVSHIIALKAASAEAASHGGPLFLASEEGQAGTDTFVTGGTMFAVRSSVGGMLAIVDALCDGGCDTPTCGLALCRPPGHHSGTSDSDGFCLVNNVSIAAAYAKKKHNNVVNRVLIFDWDVHHGQGTQEIFWCDPTVLVFNAHRHETGFYPGTGTAREIGEGAGEGYTINVPLPIGYGDGCLWSVCAELLLPAARRFQPDLILVSAGFDAADGDPLGGCHVSPRFFGLLTSELRLLADELCGGRVLLALEGGYSAVSLRDCVGEVVETLTDPHQTGANSAKTPFSVKPDWVARPIPGSQAAIHKTRNAHTKQPLWQTGQ